MATGAPLGLHPGHTSSIRRIEGAMLSYHADMDNQTNPYELGMGRLVDLETDDDFIGKAALERIREQGVSRILSGIEIDATPLPGPNSTFWPVYHNGVQIGRVTSAVYSPRLKRNIALAMLNIEFAAVGSKAEVDTPAGRMPAQVVNKPFYDPKKKLAQG